MYIEKLEIDNFKSFAENITIPFLKGFTTITGPNGSGKSNIIDSVMFALGLASARNLRTEQLSDFISTFTKKNEAVVKVWFGPDNENEHPITVARKIRKSSQGYNSVYYLNDKTSTLMDIHSELEKYHITPHSYNVIMQGDVVSIINCSNVERRKIIDEIAGVADFNRRIDKAQEELLTVQERVSKAELILTEVEERVNALAQEREAALKYQQLKDEKTLLEGQVSTVKYFDLKRALELAHQNILEADKRKAEEKKELKKLNEKIEAVNQKYAEISALVKKNGEDEQIETKKKAEEIKGQVQTKQNAISFAEKQIHDNKKTIENAKNGIENYNQKIEKSKFQITQKEEQIKEVENNIKLQREELQKKIEESSGLSANADKQMAERKELSKQLDDLKTKEFSVLSEKLPLETEVQNYRETVKKSKEKLQSLEEFKKNYSGDKDKLELEIENLEQELKDFKIAQENVLSKLDKNKNEIDDLLYDIQAAQKKMLSLEAKKDALAQVNAGDGLEALMRADIRGVHNPLFKLGKVNEEYSLALEVAMGGRMKNVVVDDEMVASRCIDYLKSSRLGVLTFLPLSKIKKAPSKLPLPKDRGVIDYAINLIDFEDEYLDAFYYALGDTLIVEDETCAHKLIGKYRTVTLDGRLFDKSGAITGGDRKKSGLKFSGTEDEELEKYRARFKELQAKKDELENEQKELTKKQDDIRQNFIDSQNALISAKGQLKTLTERAGDNDTNISECKNTIKELEPKIAKIEKELDKYELQLAEVSAEEVKVQEKIDVIDSNLSSEELKKLKDITDAIEKQIRNYETKILNIQNEISQDNNNIEFQKDLIKTQEDSIKKLTLDNENFENDKLRYAKEIEGLQVQIDELEEKIKELGQKLAELQAERDEVQKEKDEVQGKITQKEMAIEQISEQVESYKTRRNELEPQLNSARDDLMAAGIDIKTLQPTEISIEEITGKIQKLQKRMDDMGDVNMKAIKQYEEVKERQKDIKTKIETLIKEKEEISSKMSGYEQLKKETFMTTYNEINKNFVSIFSKLAEGEGTLMLENPESPFEGGLTIKAQVRDKQKQKLNSLSGGEKSLTALAFVFAIQQYMPAPFYALDEVDANLDGMNVERLSEIIGEQAKNTQFIVVSHRKPMIESASRTIGVSQKEKGKTKVTGYKHREQGE